MAIGITTASAASGWTGAAPLPTARYGLASVTGADGRIYAIGGYNGSGFSNKLEAYDPGTNSWSTLAPMPTPRRFLAAAAGRDGRIYAIGGQGSTPYFNTVEAYDPGSNSWSTVAPMPTPRGYLAAATGPDGRIYAIGGYNGSLSNKVEAYDPGSNMWSTVVAQLPTARRYLAATTGPDGRIYAIGGQSGSGLSNSNVVEAYDTRTNAWSTAAPMPTARFVLGAAAGPDGRVYAIGGNVGTGLVNTVEAYDPVRNAWSTAASMPTARGYLATATGSDGRIYAIGGYDGNPLSVVETYTTPSVTSTTVASSDNPSEVGHPVTYTATIDPAPDGGSVAFTDNGNPVDSCQAQAVTAGLATCTITSTTAGVHRIEAAYSGNVNFWGSTSTALAQVVVPAATTTTLASSSNPAQAGRPVTFTASVSPSPDGGSVAFFYDGSPISSCAAQPIDTPTRRATCTFTPPAASPHQVLARFSGTANFTSSTSDPLILEVNPAPTPSAQPSTPVSPPRQGGGRLPGWPNTGGGSSLQ